MQRCVYRYLMNVGQECSERTLVLLAEEHDGLECPGGEVLDHQQVMKSNLKTAGSYEYLRDEFW